MAEHNRGDELQDLHNKGQEDYAEGKSYDTPHEAASWGLSNNPEDYEDNDTYYDGWKNSEAEDE